MLICFHDWYSYKRYTFKLIINISLCYLFLISNKGKSLLVYDNHVFWCNKTASFKKYWVCQYSSNKITQFHWVQKYFFAIFFDVFLSTFSFLLWKTSTFSFSMFSYFSFRDFPIRCFPFRCFPPNPFRASAFSLSDMFSCLSNNWLIDDTNSHFLLSEIWKYCCQISKRDECKTSKWKEIEVSWKVLMKWKTENNLLNFC